MKFHVTMLCGGKSMMLTPSENIRVDLIPAKEKVSGVSKSSKDLLEFTYKDIMVTVYASGSVFFYHYTDTEKAFVYANEILTLVST